MISSDCVCEPAYGETWEQLVEVIEKILAPNGHAIISLRNVQKISTKALGFCWKVLHYQTRGDIADARCNLYFPLIEMAQLFFSLSLGSKTSRRRSYDGIEKFVMRLARNLRFQRYRYRKSPENVDGVDLTLTCGV